jgi:hypothetical protein
MNNWKNHRSVFQHLTRDEMMRYRMNRLSLSEKKSIDVHLKECTLCKEATNGISKMDELSMYRMLKTLKRSTIKITKKTALKGHERIIWTAALLSGILILAFVIYFLMIRTAS